MHKIFAKTLFLGKNVVFLPHCHSTNQVARELASKGSLKPGSIVWSDFQEKGRGQQGNAWLSEHGKNLLFSIYLRPDELQAREQYKLNMLISLALRSALAKFISLNIEIKWPNDIYCNDQKIAGILIESTISKSNLQDVVIGVGLNVNQSHFSLPNATSMKLESGETFDRDLVLETILLEIEKYHDGLFHGDRLRKDYLSHLRWMGQKHLFRIDGKEQMATIKGINEFGKLEVLVEEKVRHFDVKEIEYLA